MANHPPTFHWALRALKTALALLLMAVLVWYVDPLRLWASLNALKGKVFWASITLGAVGIAVQLAKWQLLLRRFRPATTWAEGFRSLLAGFGLGLLSPGRVGELGRGVVLGGKQATWIGLSIVDRASSATVTLVLGWLALVVLRPGLGAGVLGAGLALGALALRAWPRLCQWAMARGWGASVAQVLEPLDRKVWGRIACWSVLFNLVFCGQFLLLLCSWGIPPARVALGIPLFFALKLLLPFSVMEIGVREGVALLVFTPLGLDPAVAFNAAFIQFIINVVVPGIGGWLLLYGQYSHRLGGRVSLRGLAALSLETRRSR